MKTFALLYPLRESLTEESASIFASAGRPPAQAAATKLLNTTVFTRGNVAIRVFQLDGDLEDAIQHLMQLTVVHNLGHQLAGIVALNFDLSSPSGLRRFFETQLMERIV